MSTVAVLVEKKDFLTMRKYASFFPFPDYPAYLRQVADLLRVLAGQERHLRVALFDPDDFARFCVEEKLQPDAVDVRARYTAEVAALKATVPYDGQPLDSLRAQLLKDTQRQLTWERAAAVLAAAGACACCGHERGQIAFRHATRALAQLFDAAGSGAHHLVCSVVVDGVPLLATLSAERGATDSVQVHEGDALVWCSVLAAALAVDGPGGIVMRTTVQGGDIPEVLRGWRVEGGWLSALTEGEVFSAYCTDALTGEPIPPEPGVEYRAGSDVPRPADGH